MEFPYFLVISGPPASGKTTLGYKLKNHYNLPFIYKDLIKETLFDTLGIADRDWSSKLGFSSMVLLYKLIDEILSAKKSLIVESAFLGPEESKKMNIIITKNNAKPIQIHCSGTKEVIMKRFEERNESEFRHKGHHRKNILKDLEIRLENNSYGKLELNENLILLNTDDFANVDLIKIISQIDRFIKTK